MNRHDRRAAKSKGLAGQASRDPRMDGAYLLYGGRTIELIVLSATKEDPKVVAKTAELSARGPRLDMALVAGHVFEEDSPEAARLWEEIRSTTPGAEILHPEGRTVRLTLLVNTDEDATEVAGRVQAACRTLLTALIIVGSEYEKDDPKVKELWERIWQAGQDSLAREPMA